MAAAVGRSDPMQTAVIKTLIELGVAHEVAPYQADAQLVQAEAERRADYIWSSDTDMLAHGGQRLIVDWNWTTGRAIVVTADALFNSTHGSDNRMLSILRKYKLAALQLMTVVKSDYHDIKGMGAKTWMDIVDEIGSVDVTVFANYLVSNVEKREKGAVSLSRLDKAQILDGDFTNKLLVCVSNFKDALVYDCSANRVVSLGGKCAEEVNKMPHLGSLDLFEDSDILMKHVTGRLSGKHHVATDVSPPDYLSPPTLPADDHVVEGSVCCYFNFVCAFYAVLLATGAGEVMNETPTLDNTDGARLPPEVSEPVMWAITRSSTNAAPCETIK